MSNKLSDLEQLTWEFLQVNFFFIFLNNSYKDGSLSGL